MLKRLGSNRRAHRAFVGSCLALTNEQKWPGLAFYQLSRRCLDTWDGTSANAKQAV